LASRKEITEELWHVRRDLRTFNKAQDAIQERLQELDNNPTRRDKFLYWAATQALMNILVLCRVRCEGLIEDYEAELEKLNMN